MWKNTRNVFYKTRAARSICSKGNIDHSKCVCSNRQIFNNYSLKSRWIVAEYLSELEVNILPLSPRYEKISVLVYTHSVIHPRFRRKPLKIDSETLAKREFTTAILFLFGLRIIHSVGGEKCSLARDSEPIRLLKTPRSLSVCYLKKGCSCDPWCMIHVSYPTLWEQA